MTKRNHDLSNNQNNVLGAIVIKRGAKVTFNASDKNNGIPYSVTSNFIIQTGISGETEIKDVTIISSNTVVQLIGDHLKILDSDNLGIPGYNIEDNHQY